MRCIGHRLTVSLRWFRITLKQHGYMTSLVARRGSTVRLELGENTGLPLGERTTVPPSRAATSLRATRAARCASKHSAGTRKRERRSL